MPGGLSDSSALARDYDVALLDLDGVVYVGASAVPGAVAAVDRVRAAGMRVGYVTNNAARPPRAVASQLRELGLSLDDADVVTSAQAAARLVAGRVPSGSRVLVVGGDGLVEALAEHGLHAVSRLDDGPAAVVQGFDPTVGWELLAEGAYAVAAGLPWVASNLDRTIPTPRGRAPGNGTLVAAVREATGTHPVVAGKPEPALVEESVLRTDAKRPLMVGDRLDTDIEGAGRAGIPSLLVLTGVTTLDELFGAVGNERPDFVAADLGGLLHPHEPVTVDAGVARCTGWMATVAGGRLELTDPSDPANPANPVEPDDRAATDGAAGTAALRAVVTAAWEARDGGAPKLDGAEVANRLREMMNSGRV
ncbi:MAG: HAD-IIA family hydrolase [Nocardioidaceae bacterium]|nr:HAD-IIA family hydrolase [Nocardioidaceae bacterium]